MKKLKNYLINIYDKKLIYEERYFVDVVISFVARLLLKMLDFLEWLFKHEKLTIIFYLILVLLFFYILIYIVVYFLLGFNFFMERIGLEEVIELEKKIYHLYTEK